MVAVCGDQGEDISFGGDEVFSWTFSALWLSPFGPLNVSLGLPH